MKTILLLKELISLIFYIIKEFKVFRELKMEDKYIEVVNKRKVLLTHIKNAKTDKERRKLLNSL